MLKTVTISRLSMQPINMGLINEECQDMIDLLNQSLAITYSYLVLVKTGRYHWEMVGQQLQFLCLYKSWKEHCHALTVEIDEVEEQIILLGSNPQGIIEGIARIASVKQQAERIPVAIAIISQLLKDHEEIVGKLRQYYDFYNNQTQNYKTAEFLDQLMRQHQKIAGMLHYFLKGASVASNRLQPEGLRKIGL